MIVMRSLFLTSLFALVSQTALASEPQFQFGHPVTETDPGELTCFMVSSAGRTLDLNRLCGGVPARQGVNTFVSPTPTPVYQGGNSGVTGSDNRCVNPDDIAADGSRCGGRASRSRPGGR